MGVTKDGTVKQGPVNIYAQMKYVRNDIEAEQKRVRKKETAELNKMSHAYKPKAKESSKFGNERAEALCTAEKHGVSQQELKSCGIDVIRNSTGADINRVSNGVVKVHDGSLKFRDIHIYFNDALTEQQQKLLYQAVMDVAGNREKLDQLERISRQKYLVSEMREAVKMIKSGCPQQRINALFAVTELKGTHNFNSGQKNAIQFAFDQGLSKQQILRVAKPGLDQDQMREIIRGYQNNLSEKQIALFASPKFSAGQMHIISYALAHGADFDSVKAFAKPSISKEEMSKQADKAYKIAKRRAVPMEKRIAENKEKRVLSHSKSKREPVRTNEMSI